MERCLLKTIHKKETTTVFFGHAAGKTLTIWYRSVKFNLKVDIGLQSRPAFGGTVPLFYQMSRVPLNHGNVPLFVRSRIFFARAQFVTLSRCPDVDANHPIERNYGNSVRFLAKIPNGRPTAAESPCYSVFWNAIDFCRLYRPTLKKISMWALPTVPLFAGKSRFFMRNVPLKHSPGWQV